MLGAGEITKTSCNKIKGGLVEECEEVVEACSEGTGAFACESAQDAKSAMSDKIADAKDGEDTSVFRSARTNIDVIFKHLTKGEKVEDKKPPKDKKVKDEDEADEESSDSSSINAGVACADYSGLEPEEKKEYAACKFVAKAAKVFCDTPEDERGLGDENEDSLARYECTSDNKHGQINSDFREALKAWEEEGNVYDRARLLFADSRLRSIVAKHFEPELDIPEDKDSIEYALGVLRTKADKTRFSFYLKDKLAFDENFDDYTRTISATLGYPVLRTGMYLQVMVGAVLPMDLYSEVDSSGSGNTRISDEVACSHIRCDGGKVDPSLDNSSGSEPSAWKMGYPYGGAIGAIIGLGKSERIGLVLGGQWSQSERTARRSRTTDIEVTDLSADIGIAVQISKLIYANFILQPGYRWLVGTEKTTDDDVEEVVDSSGQRLDAKRVDFAAITIGASLGFGIQLTGPLFVEASAQWKNFLDSSVDKRGKDPRDPDVQELIVPDGADGHGDVRFIAGPKLIMNFF